MLAGLATGNCSRKRECMNITCIFEKQTFSYSMSSSESSPFLSIRINNIMMLPLPFFFLVRRV